MNKCLFIEATQKDFNRRMKYYLNKLIPAEDQHLGVIELREKYPEKIDEIKEHLKYYVPAGLRFNLAWSRALHSIRQHKYVEKKKK